MDDLNDLEGFVHTGAIGSKVDHIRLNTECGQDDKGKVIVCGYEYLLIRLTSVFATCAAGIVSTGGAAHTWAIKIIFIRTNRNV